MKSWIVLPAYNEEVALPLLLDSLIELFSDENRSYAIIVVNDGSTDNTAKVIEGYEKKAPLLGLHNNPNRGLAETMRRGLLEAVKRADKQDIIVTMDADNTHPAGLALRMTRLVQEGNDVVIASRYREGSHVRGVPFHRLILSHGASILFRLFFPIPGVRDYTCGYRAYRASVIQDLVNRYGEEFTAEQGFSCMVDILLRVKEMKPVITEVPLVLRYDFKPGLSKMKVFQTITDTLKLMVRRRLNFD